MKITLTIDDYLLMRASQLTGIFEQTALLKAGLKALIALKSTKNAEFSNSENLVKKTTPVTLENKLFSDVKLTDDQFQTFQTIMEISKFCANLPIQDSRSEDEIFGYNDTGTFS